MNKSNKVFNFENLYKYLCNKKACTTFIVRTF